MDVVGLLADGDRLRVFASLVLGHGSVAEIGTATGRSARAVGTALARLVAGGLVDVLAQDFEPGTRYSEKQVNLILGKRYADTAALRRYLVDEGFLDREGGAGRYWRTGGTFLP